MENPLLEQMGATVEGLLSDESIPIEEIRDMLRGLSESIETTLAEDVFVGIKDQKDIASRSDEKQEAIVRWIIRDVDACDVPQDEGNNKALLYNLVQLARNGRPYTAYNYEQEQDEEIAALMCLYDPAEFLGEADE